MTENDLTIRIFGLSGDDIAAYALATTKCLDCKAKVGEQCTKASGNRTVCVSRFKYAISVLDKAACKAIMAELDKIDADWKEPKPVDTEPVGKHDRNMATKVCPGCLAYPRITPEVINEHHGYNVFDTTGGK